ncbi:DAO-domain-containing protein [Gonapodya prolifera JEL478]|uniref:DAO-domain-containing protein n=1 Tax=Gonapodya prolifera (strain JEL478) TaxID=1344416 RepID=A0A139ANK8_GONPJ|nr:DAO-domain-containing protein [Gonapodya prolifera JEL478]|eukprot:KXS18224.1 DAO-domain-containing protein [Gonapodya prolifera JEL478]
MRDIEELVADRLALGRKARALPVDWDTVSFQHHSTSRAQVHIADIASTSTCDLAGQSSGSIVAQNCTAANESKSKRKHMHWPDNHDDAVEISRNMLVDPDVDFDEDLRAKEWDVIVIGAGVVGGAIARHLSRYSFSVLVLEKSSDVAQGASKANSGIVHGGYDEEHGTVKSKVCYAGNRMFGPLNAELNFGFRETGALVIAFASSASDPNEARAADEASLKELKRLLANGTKNGVQRLEIIGKERVLELEPHINPNVIGALHCPTVGITSPYEFCIALFENAVHNGVTLLLDHEVTDIQRSHPGNGNGIGHGTRPSGNTFSQDLADAMRELNIPIKARQRHPELDDMITPDQAHGVDKMLSGPVFSQNADHEGFVVHTSRDEGAEYGFRCRIVINCAGLASGDVARMVGEPGFRIEPRKGEYILLDRTQAEAAKQVLFPLPDKRLGKGILVSQTYHGNLLLGPTSREMSEQMSNKEVLKMILRNARRTTTHFDPSEAITSYTGLRAKSSTKDFIVALHPACANFINVAGIDSPGLTASPAIAVMVEDILRSSCAAVLDADAWKVKPTFSGERRAIIKKKTEEWDGKVDDPRGMQFNVICRCERVSEAEIVDAIHRPLPCVSTDAVKRRTRAGMGRCQGTFCEPRVAGVVARELGVPSERVPRRGRGSSLLPNRRVTVQDMRELEKLADETEAAEKPRL